MFHVNELNADYLELLIKILKEMGYSIIPLEEALKDGAYLLPEAFHEKGISWIERWRIAKGLEMKPQPAVSDWILKMAGQI